MTIRLCSLTALLGAGVACTGDKGVVTYNDAPAVSILEPIDGMEIDEGEAVYFSGVVSDDGGVEELLVEWTSSVDGILPDDDGADPDGYVEFATASLSEGRHVISLRATDAEGARSEATVEIEVLDVPDLPSITVDHPVKGEIGLDGSPFIFAATVEDHQDAPEDLFVELVASPGGLVCELAVDGSGRASCAETLAIGSYVLTFYVTDTEDNTAEATALFEVVDELDYDFDGDGYSVNGGDCNDSNDEVYPGAPEICDGLDNDCIEATPIDVGTDCYDDDGDGHCELPPCVNAKSSIPDCDDSNPELSPSTAEELPNYLDDDCDGTVDEGTVHYDDDGDGYCESPKCVNTGNKASDCDDDNPDISPGEPEQCGDDIDNDCDGSPNGEGAIGCVDYWYDGDGDGFGAAGATECWCAPGAAPWTGTNDRDCFDGNPDANPDQTSYFASDRGDGSFDYNCNGSSEKELLGVSGGCDWEIIEITCEVNGEGWDGSEPACGVSGQWVDDCDASYDALCYALCLLSADPIGCLITSCGATCDPDYTPSTQACR